MRDIVARCGSILQNRREDVNQRRISSLNTLYQRSRSVPMFLRLKSLAGFYEIIFELFG